MAATLAWLLAENADFGMSPGMQASPTTKMLASILDCMLSGSIGQKPDLVGEPGLARDLAGRLRRDHVDERAL